MKKLLFVSAVLLTGCSNFQGMAQYWPKDHDPVMFNHLVTTDIAVARVDCDKPDWTDAHRNAEVLAQYAEWRRDPQALNLKGLVAHTDRMTKGGSKAFCELGKRTAAQRITATKTAWQGR